MARKKQSEDDDIIGTPNSDGPAAGELLQFIERFEQLQSEKEDVMSQQRDLLAEAKGRGYDTKAMKVIIRERKANADDLAEFQSVLELYRSALGME